MKQLDELRHWYSALQTRERYLVAGAATCIVVTLFYLIFWEPLTLGLRDAEQRHANERETLAWMTSAAAEARSLRAGGASNRYRNTNQPVTLLVERSATTAGLKQYVSKIESGADRGARVMLDDASFDQMLVWLNTLDKQYGILVVSADIERGKTAGLVDARLTLNRPEGS